MEKGVDSMDNSNKGIRQDKRWLNSVNTVEKESNYTVHIDLAEVLRAYTEGMVTAFNLGLMERNMRNDKNMMDD